MGLAVVTGAKCMCMFGSAPCTLNVTSQQACLLEGKPLGTIQDMKPGVNIPGFGMCMSLANPTVAAATAAALGVLTPQKCTMIPAGPWIPPNPKTLIQGQPVLANDAILMCAFGAGMIQFISPGQQKILV